MARGFGLPPRMMIPAARAAVRPAVRLARARPMIAPPMRPMGPIRPPMGPGMMGPPPGAGPGGPPAALRVGGAVRPRRRGIR